MEEFKMTKEEYEDLLEYITALRMKIQDLEDIVINDISNINISDDAVTGRTIIDNAITADHIQALAIDASKIAVGTITSDQIEEGTIAADRLKVGDITAIQIASGSITAGLLKTGGQAFSHSMEFSSTDTDTVAWTAGTLKTADGTSYSIDAGNTGNMTARTYIYLDKSVSITVLQTSISYDAPLGDNRIPIATAQNGTGNAIFQVFAGGGGVFISGGMIAAHTIGATQITAGAITADEMTITNLADIANMQLGTTGHIRTAGKTSYTDTTAGFWLGYSSGYKLNIGYGSGTVGNYLQWSGTALTIRGKLYVGGGTNEDIYFEDSNIRLYDGTVNTVMFSKTSYFSFKIVLGTTTVGLNSPNGSIYLGTSSKNFFFYPEGTLQLPTLTSAPTGHTGDLAFDDGDQQTKLYTGGAWRHHTTSANW